MPDLALLAARALECQRAVAEHMPREPACSIEDDAWVRWAD